MRVYVKLVFTVIFIISCCAPSQAAFFIGLKRASCDFEDEICDCSPGDPTCTLQLTNVSADGLTAVGVAVDWGDNSSINWNQTDGWQYLIDSGPGYPTAVSGDGSVVVGHSYADIEWPMAFRWTEGNGRVYLWEGEASDISDDGSVVVGIVLSGEVSAVRWTESTGLEYLGNLTGASSSVASAISGDGSTVVGYSGAQAFRWTASEGMKHLRYIWPIGSTSRAYDVSTNGKVIVGYVTSGRLLLQKKEAFRWTKSSIVNVQTQNGTMAKLGHLPGTSESCAYGVSGDGSIVVGQSGDQAFIWDKTNGMRNLAEVLVDEYGLDLKGYDLEKAKAISADGKTIIGDDWIANISDDAPLF